jgi:serine/threonine-protein kinase
MALEPDDRYPTAAAFQDALESYLDTSAKRVGERDLAALASSTFAKERAEIAAKIDARLRGGGDGDDERLPSLSIAPERPRSSEDEETRDAVAAPSASSKREPPPTVSTGARPVRRVRYALVGLAALPVIALAAMFAIRRAELDPAIPPPTAANEQMTAAPVKAEAPATSAPEPSTIVLSVTVTPPDAVVTLDGARLPSNPFESQMPRDGAAHKLRVVAEGHLADERLIVFDRDRAVAVDLQETAPPSTRGAPRPRRPTSSSTPPKPSGSPAAPGPDSDLSKDAARPRRTIDEKDPYPR